MSQMTVEMQQESASRVPGFRQKISRPSWSGFTSLSILNALRGGNTSPSSNGASDRELQTLASPLGRLTPDDVRWDVINTAGSGRRYRI